MHLFVQRVWMLVALLGVSVAVGATQAYAAQVDSVTVVDVLNKIIDAEDVVSVGESMVIVTPRNGSGTGMLVLRGSDFTDLKVEINKQTAHAGPAPEAFDVFFAHRRYAPRLPDWRLPQIRKRAEDRGSDPDQAEAKAKRNAMPWYDVLLEEVLVEESAAFILPPEDLLPVVIRVECGPDSEAGTYGYVLSVADKKIDVEVKVGPFVVPAVEDFSIYSGYVWSEMNLARNYDVEPWSEAHWDLVGQHFQLLARLANKPLVLTMLPNDYLGEEHGKIRFRKEGERYVPDLTIVNRYLDLYKEHIGQPDPLILHHWTMPLYGLKSKHSRVPPKPLEEVEVPISVYQADGSLAVEHVDPPTKDPEFWKTLMEAMYAAVAERGWPKESLLLGTASDREPRPETVAVWKEIAPDAEWAMFGHHHGNYYTPDEDSDGWVVEATGMKLGHVVTAWAPRLSWPREDGIMGGWNLERKDYTSMRNYLSYSVPLSQWRLLPEGTCMTGQIPEGPGPEGDINRRNFYNGGRDDPSAGGFSRIPFDFWLPGRGSDITLSRFEGHFYHSRDVFPGIVRSNMPWLVYAGPEGPVPTMRSEMLREGLQETEARIMIERGLLEHAAQLDETLRQACVDLLEQRIRSLSREGKWEYYGGLGHGQRNTDWGLPDDWRSYALQLYSLAGRVQEAVKQ